MENQAELTRMMQTYGTQLLRLCTLYLKDRMLAEDAVQETFVRAWRADFRQECSEKTFLTRIAINICKNYLRTPWHTRRASAELLDLNNLVSYDDQTQTAIFCLRGSGLQMSGAQPGSQHTYTLTLGTILPKAHELTFTLPQSTASETITQTETIDQPLDLSLSRTDEPAEVPQAVMSEPVAEGVTVTAAGRLGDDYHVRLALSDCTAGKLNSDISTDSPLKHPDSYVSNIIFDDGHAIDYILHGARIPDASATDDLSFRLTYYTEPVLYGDWTIPVTFTVSIQYQSGEVITCSGNGWSLTDPAADGQTQYFMEWSTDEPVELAQVASVTAGDFVLTPVQE